MTPDTVLRWQRRRFREYWTQLSGRPTGGRPPVNAEIAALVSEDGRGESPVGRPAHPWRAPEARHRRGRAHRLPADAEAAPPTVSDLADVPRQPCPGLGRRSTSSPCPPPACASSSSSSCSLTIAGASSTSTSPSTPPRAWTAQQIVDAFPDDSAPAYLLRDRDRVYGEQFRHRVKGMRIDEVLTAPHSPWQNPFAERLIGSIRRVAPFILRPPARAKSQSAILVRFRRVST